MLLFFLVDSYQELLLKLLHIDAVQICGIHQVLTYHEYETCFLQSEGKH